MPGSSKPRIVFINHWAAHLGGAEHSLIDILQHASLVTDTVLITAEQGKLVTIASTMNVHVVVVPCSKKIVQLQRRQLLVLLIVNFQSVVSFIRYILKVRKHITALSPDCIHANIPKSHITLMAVKLMGYRGRAIIHMREIFHNNRLIVMLYHVMYILSGGTEIIAISNAVKNALPRTMHHRTIVIYNGILLHNRIQSYSRRGIIKYLFLGRIVPWKGCDLLVNAFEKMVLETGSDSARLTLIGDTLYWDDSYRTIITTLIECSPVARFITLLPATDDLVNVYLNHDIVCLPSQCEPFGRVAAEAQAFGMPVIGFAQGGLPEVVVHGKTGLLVSEYSIDAYTDAMITFLHNPEIISKMGMYGREWSKRMFDTKKQTPEIIRFILGAGCK